MGRRQQLAQLLIDRVHTVWASAICGGSRTGCVLLPHEAAPPRAVYRGAVTGASTGCARRRPHNARHADTARRDIPAADAAREHRSDDRQGLCRFGGERA